jgi:hypothetical protein
MQNFDHNIVGFFKKNANTFAKNWQKSQKTAKRIAPGKSVWPGSSNPCCAQDDFSGTLEAETFHQLKVCLHETRNLMPYGGIWCCTTKIFVGRHPFKN